MSFDIAKKFIDKLLSGEDGFDSYLNDRISPGIVLDFIGGEPLLEVELIDRIIDYFREQTLLKGSKWADLFRVSITSNGVLYFNEDVQRFLEKHKNHLSFAITVDGNKELHDACRKFHDGRPSYDLASGAVRDWMEKGNYMSSKITVAPENINFLYAALVHMVEFGYDDIFANCVFEKGWTIDHAKKLYQQLKLYADYANERDIVDKIYVSMFEEDAFGPKDNDDNDNWCGGTGDMLAIDPDGYLYPCLRYMESSLGKDREPLRIGHIDRGLCTLPEEKSCVDCLSCITRQSQSTKECFQCPIAEGCAWCSGYNYQVFGTADKRATFICEMHKARALANCYYWNTYYRKNNLPYRQKLYVPDEWALRIIDEDELKMLRELEGV